MGEGTRAVGFTQKKRPCFFKVFFPGLNSEQLEISPAFLKHIRGEPSGTTCSLMGPSGNIWHVDLVKNGSGLFFFRSGWKEFVRDHSLRTGEFLIFEYGGNSHFSVLIFDASACEREDAFDVRSSQDALEKSEGREAVSCVCSQEGLGVTPKKKKKKKKKKQQQQERECEKGNCVPVAHSSSQKQARDGSSPQTQCCKKFWTSQRRPVTEEEIDRAYKAARSFKSSNPSLVLVMRQSGVYTKHMLHLPPRFSRQHLPKVTERITLWGPRGNSWTVKYIPSKSGHFFSAGWRKFAVSNHLEQDDACVFELVKTNEIRVHIYRVVEDVKPLIRIQKVVKC